MSHGPLTPSKGLIQRFEAYLIYLTSTQNRLSDHVQHIKYYAKTFEKKALLLHNIICEKKSERAVSCLADCYIGKQIIKPGVNKSPDTEVYVRLSIYRYICGSMMIGRCSSGVYIPVIPM